VIHDGEFSHEYQLDPKAIAELYQEDLGPITLPSTLVLSSSQTTPHEPCSNVSNESKEQEEEEEEEHMNVG